jgi:hypothetical protein
MKILLSILLFLSLVSLFRQGKTVEVIYSVLIKNDIY